MNQSLALVFLLVVIYSCSKESDPVEVPDTTPPSISVSIPGHPESGSTEPMVVSTQLEIVIDAKDAGGIAKVEAFINSQKVGEDTQSPYRIIIDLTSFSSKSATSFKLKEYNLEVRVTDNSGNVSSNEQLLIIDNEMPAFTDVSLEGNTIINGSENMVTFSVSDNENLSTVRAYINNELFKEFTDGIYQLNINTVSLEDGPYLLKFEATDSANNVGNFEIPFISDNSGPEISVETLYEGMVLDTVLFLSPDVTDEYSGITSFKTFLDDELINNETSGDINDIRIDPDTLVVGQHTFRFEAIDSTGNSSQLSLETTVLRHLLTVKMDEGFLKNTWNSFWVLLSEMDGSTIAYKKAAARDTELTFHAEGEFAIDKEFMVSFIAEENQYGWILSNMTVVQNLTRANFNNIHFTHPIESIENEHIIEMDGFETDDLVNGQGASHQFYSNDQNITMNVRRVTGYGRMFPESGFLIGENFDQVTPYSYLKLDNPWDTNLIVHKQDFSSENIDMGFIDMSQENLGNPGFNLQLRGYDNQEDYDNNTYHTIYMYSGLSQYGGGIQYYYPDIFFKYRHQLRVNFYSTVREGIPLNQYDIPDWTVNAVQSANRVDINHSGTGFSVGRLYLDFNKPSGGSQSFVVLYNGTHTGSLYMPQLPAAMEGLSIYDSFQQQSYELTYADLSSFEGINSYEEYLNQVVAPYKEHVEAAPMVEVLSDGLVNILYNWGFKYNY